MSKRLIGNIVSTVLAVGVCVPTIYLSYTMRPPQIPLDWAALVFSGLTTGIITFFVSWGHFQKDPGDQPNTPTQN